MRYYITLLLIAVMTLACNSKNHKVSLSKGKLITYSIPYSGSIARSTRFTMASGQEAIAFFNTETYKRMDIFTMEGKLVKTIPLNELCIMEHHIDDIAALNRDSFLALGQYHNNLYLFNSEGKILLQTHISDTVSGNNPDWYTELSANIGDEFVQDENTILLSSSYYERHFDKTLSREASLLQWYRLNRTLPYFLSIRDVFSPSPQMRYALPGFYNRFLPDNGVNVEMSYYSFSPQNVLLYSHYSDSLYVLNKQTYDIEKAIKIKSSYTAVGRHIETIESLGGDSLNLRGNAAGLVRQVLFDKYRNLYYIALRHSVPLSTPWKVMRHNRKWSLIIYDKDFKQLDEINIDPKYYPGEILVTREGIMLQLDDLEKPNVPTQFQLFYVHQK